MTANSNYDEMRVVSGSEDEEEFVQEWTGAYHPSFPNQWTESHVPGTGPEQCLNCADHGCYQGQFIGYCANCAAYVYEGRRGRGFMGNGVELVDEQTRDWISVYDTYLSHVEFARFSDDLPHVVEEEESDDQESDDMSIADTDAAGHGSVFEAHFEGGYADF
jgi:hypothetical protein